MHGTTVGDERRARREGEGGRRRIGCRLTFHGLPADELLRRVREERRAAVSPPLATAGAR